MDIEELIKEEELTPVFRELPADLETPVSVFLKISRQAPSFLLESVEKGEHLGRYSFLGTEPEAVIVVEGRRARAVGRGKEVEVPLSPSFDPLHLIQRVLGRFRMAPVAHLPRFLGGALGYLGYEFVGFLERLPLPTEDELGLPDAAFLLVREMVIFDHVKQSMKLLSCRSDIREAEARLDLLEERLRAPLLAGESPVGSAPSPLIPGIRRERFEEMVARAKEYIFAGDIFQVVLSQRWRKKTAAHPFQIYRALRMLNPSPYMFYLDFGDFQLIGSSPEMLVRLEGRQAETRPIAGTRPRGGTPEEDEALSAQLLADPKERAEHVMLVDLGRNDLGRVCRFGTVKVPEFMTLEKYSHVIHIVSSVRGELAPGEDAFSLLRACFPAGTVSGAPKVRAMEVIAELEGIKRGPYAGAVGYFGFNGNMDTCITIRTIVRKGDTVYLQGGAGIVADSIPEREHEECQRKVAALARAVEIAEEGRP